MLSQRKPRDVAVKITIYGYRVCGFVLFDVFDTLSSVVHAVTIERYNDRRFYYATPSFKAFMCCYVPDVPRLTSGYDLIKKKNHSST